MDYDLGKTRWKMLDELDQGEKDFLKEHEAELDDGEKTAFKSFLSTEEPALPIVETPVIEEAVEEKPPEEPITFKSTAERDAYVAQEVAKREAENPQPVVETQIPIKQSELFKNEMRDKKYENPLDYHEDSKKLLVLEAQEERDAEAKIVQNFETEYDNLAKEKTLPTANTDEGRKFKLDLVDFGKKHGKGTYHDAYELWTQVPEQFGGGFKFADQKAKEVENKEQISKQKAAASGMNATTPSDPPVKKGLAYKQIHENDLDTLLDM